MNFCESCSLQLYGAVFYPSTIFGSVGHAALHAWFDFAGIPYTVECTEPTRLVPLQAPTPFFLVFVLQLPPIPSFIRQLRSPAALISRSCDCDLILEIKKGTIIDRKNK
jgi:hypothetical protein